MQPKQVSDALLVFPGSVKELMVPEDQIPKDYDNKVFFTRLQQLWFFQGIEISKFAPARDGVDEDMALRHLMAIQRSFEPKHEHKQACVAWLMSLWFQGPEVKRSVEEKPVVKKPMSKGRQKRRRR